MASGYKSLEVGSEAWLEIPIVTGATESGEVLVLACVKHCLPEVHNAARQNDGGPDVAPLLRARARSQAIEENTLKVVKKKTTKSTQSDAQKRKLREEPKPRRKVIYIEDPPSDEDSVDDPQPPVNSSRAFPPAKHVRRQDAVLSSPPPTPAGLAGVLQESCRNPEDSAKLCQLGRAWQDWDRVQQDSC